MNGGLNMFMTTLPPPPPKPITVWVHGTRASSFIPINIKEELKKSLDQATHTPPGLHAAQSLDRSLKHYKIAKTLSDTASVQFPLNQFYVFGWSGDLYAHARNEAAQELYNCLKELLSRYEKQQGIKPPIQIITHSHGGNVVLKMAEHAEKIPSFTIHKLILLACPVQKETISLTSNPLFEQIYAIHSHIDMVQILDPQRLHPIKAAIHKFMQEKTIDFKAVYQQMIDNPLFSERHFPISSNVIHVAVSWDKIDPWNEEDIDTFGPAGSLIRKMSKPLRSHHRGILHTEFIIPSFIKQLPNLMDSITQLSKKSVLTEKTPDIELKI